MPSDEAASRQQDTDPEYPERLWERISAPAGPPRNRNGLLVGLGALVGVGVIGVCAVLLSGGTSGRSTAVGVPTLSAAPTAAATTASAAATATDTSDDGAYTAEGAAAGIAVPDAAGGLTRMTGSAADTVTTDMAKADATNETLAGAEFGAYATTGTSTYFSNLTLVPLNATLEQLEKTGPSAALKTIVKGGLTDSAVEPSAVAKGAMTCGLIKGGKVPLRACSWIDDHEYGLTVFPASLSNAAAAQYSAALWTASEGSVELSAASTATAVASGF